MSHYLGDYTALCTNIYKQKMFVDTRDTSLAPHLLEGGYWEQWITEAIRPFCQNAVFFDIGANHGWYSLVAQHAGAREVHCFEPNDRLMDLLERSMWVNGYNWHLHRIALGDQRAEATLHFNWNLTGSASLLPVIGENTTKIVAVRAFDDGVAGDTVGPCVIKLDVEGYESRVLLGAKNFLTQRSDVTVFSEYHADPDNEQRGHDMLEMMKSAGYSVGHVRHDAKIHPITYDKIVEVPDVDMLCFRRFSR